MVCQFIFLLFLVSKCYPVPDGQSHILSFQGSQFMLDGSPFRFVTCELHFARIPREYWEHRILMSKAMGCNVISAYIFWNYHEQVQGVFDFSSDNRNLSEFLSLTANLQMWFFIRPGPFVCADWDAGGHPWWILKDTNVVLRSTDPIYMKYTNLYVQKIAQIIDQHQSIKGGNILILQIENEYGYMADDLNWPGALLDMWIQTGLQIPYYQAEPDFGIKATHLPGVAIGINTGIAEEYYQTARDVDPQIPIFSSETYSGNFTHWGMDWSQQDTPQIQDLVDFFLIHDYSFSIFMGHGGTSFGFWPGANFYGLYQPDINSYDYDCPINEAGEPTEKFWLIRESLKKFIKWNLTDVPSHPGFTTFDSFTPDRFSSVQQALHWANLKPQKTPLTFEQLNHQFGLVAYVTIMDFSIAKGTVFDLYNQGSTLEFDDVHDYAQVYIDSEFIGIIERRLGQNSIKIDKDFSNGTKNLIVLVEGMGRVCFDYQMFDQKGLLGEVRLSNQNQTLSLNNWFHYLGPLDNVSELKESTQESQLLGSFFKHQLLINEIGDFYMEMKEWGKGYVWVNGYNLGRFWHIGPATRLYVPGTLLKIGNNEVIVLDLESSQAKQISASNSLKN